MKKKLKKYGQLKNIVYLCTQYMSFNDMIDLLKAKHCASFSHNGNLRNSTYENGGCRTVVSVPMARASVIFRFQGFLRTSVRRI